MLSHQGETLHHLGVRVDKDPCFETTEDSCFETAGDSWVETTVDNEDLLEDFSGCTWSSTLFEFPPWIENLEKTMSDYDMQDVKLLPNEPLTLSKVVVSSTAKLDFDVKLDNFVQVDQGRSMDTATVQSVKYSETACECC